MQAATFATSTDVEATNASGVVDDVSNANVPTFGLCMSLANPQVASATSAAGGTLTPQTCVPSLSAWTPGSAHVTVNGVAALDQSSTCTCIFGGTISVESPGQGDVSVA
jgi:hypothetical protein